MTVTIGQRSRTGVPLDLTAGLVLVMVGLCVSTVVLAFPASPGGQVGSLWLSVGGAVGVGCGSFVLARRRIGMLGTPRWLRMGPLFSAYYALVFGVNRPGNCGDSFAWKGKSNVHTEEAAHAAGEEATAGRFPAEVPA